MLEIIGNLVKVQEQRQERKKQALIESIKSRVAEYCGERIPNPEVLEDVSKKLIFRGKAKEVTDTDIDRALPGVLRDWKNKRDSLDRVH